MGPTGSTGPTETAPPAQTPSPPPVGAIVGGVIGGLALVLLAVALCFWFARFWISQITRPP